MPCLPEDFFKFFQFFIFNRQRIDVQTIPLAGFQLVRFPKKISNLSGTLRLYCIDSAPLYVDFIEFGTACISISDLTTFADEAEQ